MENAHIKLNREKGELKMNELLVFNQKALTIDSREVAEMMDTSHDQIIRKLEGAKDRKGIIEVLTDNQMVVSNYFIESSYKDGSGKQNKCYLCTKMGCEFLANKFTGKKGIIFTAKYVDKFNKMEKAIKTQIPQTYEEMIIMQAQSMMEFKKEVNGKFEVIENKIDNQITLDHGMQRKIQKAVAKRVIELLGKDTDEYKQYSKKYFAALYRDIKDRIGIPSYKDVKKKDYEAVVKYIECWMAPNNIRQSA